MTEYPKVKDPGLVGTYPALVKSGGGYVWDEVLEYRVWCHSSDEDDYYYVFDTCEEALKFSNATQGAEEPLALVLQEEYINEPQPGKYEHIKAARMTEWPVELLSRPKRTTNTIPDFLSPDAPTNRLDIIRG
ncbi:hypothetical protein [Desertivirga xinjiangensis]|uniref:hypothetical protein n=1 Tax=Desertivirga xinjiangensis TaxID=539206 RepID=UPI00210D67ED|nr:hypothetical protein [Pedobacter xinjiangensis]